MLQTISKFRLGWDFLKLVNDPNQTDVVFDMADNLVGGSLDHPAVRAVHELAMTHPDLVKLYEENYQPKKCDLQELSALPEGTLGRTFAEHMIANRLDPNFYRDVKQRHLATYLGQRMRATHDIFHVLTGLDTSVPGELALQAFSLAQIGSGINAMLIAAGILHTIKTSPSQLRAVMDLIVDAYQRGRNAKFLPAVKFDELWDSSIEQVRADLNMSTP
jgi:ubiquinone biosynthesis protein COQ4